MAEGSRAGNALAFLVSVLRVGDRVTVKAAAEGVRVRCSVWRWHECLHIVARIYSLCRCCS